MLTCRYRQSRVLPLTRLKLPIGELDSNATKLAHLGGLVLVCGLEI